MHLFLEKFQYLQYAGVTVDSEEIDKKMADTYRANIDTSLVWPAEDDRIIQWSQVNDLTIADYRRQSGRLIFSIDYIDLVLGYI